MKQRKKYILDKLLEGTNPGQNEDLIPTILDSEWPPYEDENKPFAYRVVDWRGEHVAVVSERKRAHELRSQTDFDPRLNTIYAIYPDETEKCIQSGLSIMDDMKAPNFEENWKAAMKAVGIEDNEIEKTLSYNQ